ncbi:hypothetical protein KXV44_006731 [Aspergillus fumigatus]|nr:hypothetical protein KXV44_006731 [Aspergillus fumigatus]
MTAGQKPSPLTRARTGFSVHRDRLRGDLPTGSEPSPGCRDGDGGLGRGVCGYVSGSHVIGTDLSRIQPRMVPPNLTFEVDNCCDEWVYRERFDYTHVRGLYGSVADWNRFYQPARKHLVPGGYIEQVEMGVEPTSDDHIHLGTTLRIVDESKQRMVDTGFVEVVERRYKLPIGLWSKDKHLKTLGKCFRLVIEESMEMWVMYLWTQVLGLTPAEVEMTIAEMRKAVRHPSIHGYIHVSVVHGRKPDK